VSDEEEIAPIVLLAHEIGLRLLLGCAIARAIGFEGWDGVYWYTHLHEEDRVGGLLRSILLEGPQLESHPGLHEPLEQLLRTHAVHVWGAS